MLLSTSTQVPLEGAKTLSVPKLTLGFQVVRADTVSIELAVKAKVYTAAYLRPSETAMSRHRSSWKLMVAKLAKSSACTISTL